MTDRVSDQTDRFAPVRERIVNDLKQACLDLSAAAVELFDRFDEHGIEAAWESDGVFVIARMQKAHEHLRSFLSRQATQRMLALGVSPESLARIATGAADQGERRG